MLLRGQQSLVQCEIFYSNGHINLSHKHYNTAFAPSFVDLTKYGGQNLVAV